MKKLTILVFVSALLYVWGPGASARRVTMADLAVPPPEEFSGTTNYAKADITPRNITRGPASIGNAQIQFYGACSRPGGVILQPSDPEYANCMENSEWQYGDYENSFKAVGIGIYLRP